MCGRFTLTAEQEELMERFNLTEAETKLSVRYNIAPTQAAAVILNESPQTLSTAEWGLIPSWAKDPKMGMNLINARSETLLEKASFRTIFKTRRCLVLADGFYEWRKNSDGSKTPFYVSLKDGGPFALAGLWDVWKSPDGHPRRTCTIITTDANDLLKPLHERMAVILPREKERLWIDKDGERPFDQKFLESFFIPYPSELMRAFEVSKKVNSVRNDDPSLIERVASTPVQAGLF